MKRVAALYLPNWSIDRIWQVERTAARRDARIDTASLQAAAAREREHHCSVPREAGFRPGARWAKAALAEEIARLPAHQRPPMRELGRRSEAAPHPFRTAPAREGAAAILGEERSGGRGSREEREGTGGASAPGGGASDKQGAPGDACDRPPSTTGFAGGPPARSGEAWVTVQSGSRVVVAAASPAVRAHGVGPGMALTQARALLPGLNIRAADPEGDRAALRRLAMLAARRWSPIVAIADSDTLLLDLTGVAHLFGGEERMARRILRLLARRGVTARIAIADTAGAAWALAHHGRAKLMLCPPGGQAEAIAPLPPAALRIEGRAAEMLKRLGVERIGTLAAMPRGPLVRRFGTALTDRIDQAMGAKPEPLHPVVPPRKIIVTRRFAEPIASAEAIAHWLAPLTAELVDALTAAGLGARAVELTAARVDGVPQSIRIGLARASRDGAHLLRLLARRIEEIDPGFGIDSLSLHLRRAERLGPVALVERLDEDGAPDLAPLIDTLATRIGLARLWRQRPVESDVPERSVGRASALAGDTPAPAALKAEDVRRLARGTLPPWHPHWPRPARLLHRPERVEVLALLPDHPPRRFTWRGVSHKVVRADGPERVHGEWWKRRAETHAMRDYFRVEDEQGRRYWLFRRGDGERSVTGDMRWYLHGVFG